MNKFQPFLNFFGSFKNGAQRFVRYGRCIVATLLAVVMFITMIPFSGSTVSAADAIVYSTWERAVIRAEFGVDYNYDGEMCTIHTAIGLAWFAQQVNKGYNDFAGKKVILTKDIDLNGVVFGYENFEDVNTQNSWKSIGTTNHPFRGTFNGNGCIINGVKSSMSPTPENCYFGLFGLISDSAVIENVRVTNTQITVFEPSYVGTVVGENNGIVRNSFGFGTLKVFENSDTNFRVGGLCGQNDGTIQNSCAETEYIVPDGALFAVGGIAGTNNGTVENSY
ncbi:MAG: hypothetical protein RR444_10435, partial [Oscillospiraceae bacterium]